MKKKWWKFFYWMLNKEYQGGYVDKRSYILTKWFILRKIALLSLFFIAVFAQDTVSNSSSDTLVKISFVRRGEKIDIQYERYKSVISNKQLIKWLLPLLQEIYKKEEYEESLIRN